MALNEMKRALGSGDDDPSFVADRQRPASGDAVEAQEVNELDGVEASDTLEQGFQQALNLDNWTAGERMDQLAARLEREVELAAQFEDGMAPRVLKKLEEAL